MSGPKRRNLSSVAYYIDTTTAIDTDRLSKLPTELLHRILSCLTLREAVRTSILSRNWRHNWTHLPRIILNKRFFYESFPIRRNSITLTKHAAIIDNILFRHVGSIHTFSLYIPNKIRRCPDITRWIQYLSINNISSITIDNAHTTTAQKLPSSLFFCTQLTHLSIIRCVIELPSSFKGFPILASLNVDINNMPEEGVGVGFDSGTVTQAIERLVSSCPLLKKVNIRCEEVRKADTLCIQASGKLEELDIVSYCSYNAIFLGNGTSSIKDLNVKLHSFEVTVEDDMEMRPSYVMEFFTHLPNVEKLHFSCYMWERLAISHYTVFPDKLPTMLTKLKTMHFEITKQPIDAIKQINLARCVLQSSPNLKTLEVGVSSGPKDFEWLDFDPDVSFNHLESVRIGCYNQSMGTVELGLIKALLGRAPVLKLVQIKTYVGGSWMNDDYDMKLAKELYECRRASSKVLVVFARS